MAFKRCFLLLIIATSSIRGDAARANNNFFLPGDAYFPTSLTSEGLEELETAKEGLHVFEYSSFGEYEGTFCGFAGYKNAVIPVVDKDFTANLRKAYSSMRQFSPKEFREEQADGKTKLIETNGVRVLFYPTDFEFPGRELGLRYNEDWVDQVVRFGHKPHHARLCCLVSNQDAVMESWRDAKLVSALPVVEPEPHDLENGRVVSPVQVQGEVKAIVLSDGIPFTEYYEANDRYESNKGFGAMAWIVDRWGVVEYEIYDEEGWRRNAEAVTSD
ncbi:hypothetical protein Mal64_04250 [Pseudobythopirellula maris]|uniref:Uncharacterized protein n=1 Tax=Pseudobythopirellula maris TaxID=2527991 RepID=A0A5C5ZR68_9BACT|nr:hypothetical protein [Pseudobythopirellula maris]TWT90042.1 hypothetical protein Mal64_04250 [Pseudobythopirellula maris]